MSACYNVPLWSGLLLALCLGAGSVRGQDRLVTAEGEVLSGEIISDDGHTVHIKTEGNARVLSLDYDELSVQSIYDLRSDRADPENGYSQLDLANWCRDRGLYDKARQHYQMAVDVDADLEGLVREQMELLRVYAAGDLMDKAGRLESRGKLAEAQKVLARVVKDFPSEQEADRARLRLENLARDLKDRASPSLVNAQVMGLRTHESYEKARNHLEAARDMNNRGLQATKYQPQAIDFFEMAIEQAKRGLQDVGQIDEKAVENSDVDQEISKLEQKLDEQRIEAHLHIADLRYVATSFNAALERVRKVLAIDSDNAEARDLETRIEDAKAGSGVWGWGYGRRRWAGQRPRAPSRRSGR